MALESVKKNKVEDSEISGLSIREILAGHPGKVNIEQCVLTDLRLPVMLLFGWQPINMQMIATDRHVLAAPGTQEKTMLFTLMKREPYPANDPSYWTETQVKKFHEEFPEILK